MAITQNYVDYDAGSDAIGDGTVGTPWKTLQKALDTVTRNTTDGNQINLKAGTAHVNAAALDLTTFVGGGALAWSAPLVLRGYTSAANDGGIGEIDCGGAVFVTAIHNFLTLIDLEIHTFGNNTGISVGYYTYIINCEIHKGASSPSGKYLLYSEGTLVIDHCYLHDAGTSGTCVFAFGGTVELLNSFLSGGGTWLADLRVPGRVQNCIFRADADANGVRFFGIADRTEVVGNIFYSSNGTAGTLFVSSYGNFLNQLVNNIFVGGGANAVTADRDIAVVGYNAFYGNVGNYSLSDQKRVDWTAHDVTLAANPFTDAPNGDFSLTIAGKAALRGLGWPAAYLGTHANTDGHITIGPIQYGEAEAAADYPAESDVRLGVDYDSGGSTGTLDLPGVADVQSGVTFDGATKTGTFVSPGVGDVEAGVEYGAAAEYIGTFAVPTEAQVESGIGFGAGGTEFTGSLVTGSDWTAGEKEQIRQALGITGDTAATTGTGTLEAAFAALATDSEIATAVAAAILVTPANLLATDATGRVTVGTGGGLTAQETRDALLLAPTPPGTGATDSIDDKLNTIAASPGGLTAQETADAVNNLAPVGTPAAGSIGDHLDDLAAALAAATSTLTVVSAVDGDVLTIYQAVSLSATISGLSIPAAWSKLWFTVKQDSSQADTDAIIQMIETNPGAGTDGLLRLNGAAGTAANGTLTVSQAAGTVVIDLLATVTDDLALATGLHWSLKALATAGATTLLAIGTLNVRGQATAAVA